MPRHGVVAGRKHCYGGVTAVQQENLPIRDLKSEPGGTDVRWDTSVHHGSNRIAYPA
jgi:hypothetical protein